MLSVRNAVKTTILVGIILSAAVVLGRQPHEANATSLHENGWMTVYAVNGIYGASGNEIFQGDAANHESQYCPNDPAAYWTWGTTLALDSGYWMTTSSSDGSSVTYYSFNLEDAGDPSCSQGNYWMDGYMGRFESTATIDYPPGTYYVCNGAPGYAYYGNTDNCQEAINWGRYYVG